MRLIITATCLCATLLIAGCGDSGKKETPEPAKETSVSAIPASHFTTSRPTDVKNLADVKKTAQKGDDVVFLARVGGKANPFVDSHAIFLAADPGLVSCELMGEDDHCTVPQDYCCEDPEALRAGMATVQFVDSSGRPLGSSAKGAGGLESLKFIVVEGTVRERNDDGMFLVDARQVWVGGKPTRDNPTAGSMTP
ncbi:MAG: hypothetical protein MK116_11990 [Phycisphaerales bacterium]|nr:hypothetical protein [Phycisphaerales bacterium]